MSRATPTMRKFAEHLISFETGGKKPSLPKIPVAFQVCEKLHPHLATLMGHTGFRALLTRALALASPEVPWLGGVRIKEDGVFEELGELEAQVNDKNIAEGGVVLLAQLLGLLVAFIGESLTLRMLSTVWPKLAITDLNFGDKK